MAVGTSTGIVNLLRIDDGSNDYVELSLKMTRTCQAVSFNTTGLLAVGLDRVRMDQCLHVWDVSRLSSLSKQTKGFPSDIGPLTDPAYRLEPSVSVSSVKFFEDSPLTLVVGIKAQGLRIHDLRGKYICLCIIHHKSHANFSIIDPGNGVTFHTKCNNNLAIDYGDQNYFASSALDHPGIMIWDRRATSRPVASQVYHQAVEDGELPWGGALWLERVIETDSEPFLSEGKHSFIRSLRYCRGHRGLLAILSRTGQLRVLKTDKETLSSATEQSSPELIQIQKSYEMDVSYSETSRKNDRIVAFDWVTLDSPALRPRMVVLRANGNFEILEQPSDTLDHIYKLVPWQAPHRGLEGKLSLIFYCTDANKALEGTPYHSMMKFEPSQASEMLGPLVIEQALWDIPLFGPDKADIQAVAEKALKSNLTESAVVENVGATKTPLPEAFRRAPSIAAKIRALRAFVRDNYTSRESSSETPPVADGIEAIEEGAGEMSLASNNLGSCREIHHDLLASLAAAESLPREAQCIVDHASLYRAKEKYLFDPVVNRDIVADDPWVKYCWDWIASKYL